MSYVVVIGGVIYAIVALGVFIVGILGTTQHLPGNSLIGIRVPEVRASQDIWNKAHGVAGPLWILSGIALLFGAISVFFVNSWLWIIPLAALALGLYGIGAGANLGARRAALLDAAENEAHAQAAGVRPPAVDTAAALKAASARDAGMGKDAEAAEDAEAAKSTHTRDAE